MDEFRVAIRPIFAKYVQEQANLTGVSPAHWLAMFVENKLYYEAVEMLALENKDKAALNLLRATAEEVGR